jgi:hypothetical protein
MQYYVVDTTQGSQQEKRFNRFNEVVQYLEQMSVRAYGQNRKQRMIMLEELGHGHDDSGAVNFVRSMAEKFNMGVLRDGVNKNERLRCDITSVNLFQNEEFGS